MKKLLLFVICILFVTLYASAQKEISTATYYHKEVRWISGEYNFDISGVGYDRPSRIHYYEIKEDSIIAELLYHKIYCNNNLIALVRNDAGDIYLRLLTREKTKIPWELSGAALHSPLHEDYLLYSFKPEKWNVDSVICYHFPYYDSPYSEDFIWTKPVIDTVKQELLDTVQLDHGKYHKRYEIKNKIGEPSYIVFGLGDDKRGILGSLSSENRWYDVYFRLLELYDHDELVFRSKEFSYVGLEEKTEDDPNIRIFYSPVNKSLQLFTSLPEESYTISLYRLDGTKALSFSGSSYSLSGLPPGIYLVRICTTSECFYTSKIRIE